MQTIKVPIRISEIDSKLPQPKYNNGPESSKEESKISPKSRGKPRIYSARPNKNKENIKKLNESSSKKCLEKKNPVNRLYPGAKAGNMLSPHRG